jgi:hypothetical protein
MRSAQPASASRFRTTGHFLHLGLSLQHFFFAVIDGTLGG